MLTCEFCNEAKKDVTVRRDTFALDVNNEDVRVAMCDACEVIRAGEV